MGQARCSEAQMRFWELSGHPAPPRLRTRARRGLRVEGLTRKDGTRKRHLHYACATRRQRGKEACSYSRTLNAHKIEDEVWGAVKAVLLDPGHLKRGLDTFLKVEKDGRPGEGGLGIHEQHR
jgi:hypothetical protein